MILVWLPAGAAVAAELSMTQICKAGLSVVMGRAPNIMTTEKVNNGIVYLSYRRPSDNTKWSYRCRVEGNRIIWASAQGRWRTHSSDSVVTFGHDGKKIWVKDSLSGKETFNIDAIPK
tara:strand:- start:432 stop:785 length:354 start_codon:yes stop_codon:yes gene_type:complete